MAERDRTRVTAEIAQRVLDGIDALVERLGAAYISEVPEYAALGEQVIAGEVQPVSRVIVAAFFDAVVAGREPRPSDVPDLEMMGRKRLGMGVPLEPMLHVYRIAARTTWDAVVAAARPGEEAALAELAGAWMEYMDRASSVAANAYLEASHERLRRVDARRGALLESILAAADETDVAAVAVGMATTLADAYRPVVVRGDSAATRIDQLMAAAPSGTIGGFRSGAVVLLVPSTSFDASPIADVAERATVAVGDAAPAGPELRAEVTETQRLAEAADTLGTRGVIHGDAHVIERLLLADQRLRHRLLRTLIEPLKDADRGGVLMGTLESYVASGSIPETAKHLVVHANTVSYRLRRVREITGLDPRVPADAARLVVALAASRLDGGRPA